jgi:DNA-binding beta-propeller fold protein YncE
MARHICTLWVRSTGAAAMLLMAPGFARSASLLGNDLPAPYLTILSWGTLPEGRHTGAAAAIEIDPDGKSVWVAERCGANSCEGSDLPMIVKFDASGRMVKAFDAGQLITPHGMFIDQNGNVWVTDMGVNKETTKGDVVIKFSSEGKILMTLGTPGKAGDGPDRFEQPRDVVVASNGDIFVSDSHNGQMSGSPPDRNARIVKFNKDGRFIKSWGKLGSAPGEFRTPHALAIDFAGRLYVADRGNNRIQVFDLEGNFLDEWRQFGRPSGIYIRGATLYVSDSESNSENHLGGWKRGVRVGNITDGKVKYFIPWLPERNTDAAASGIQGVAADRDGNIYGSNVYLREFFAGGPWGEIRKFVRQ